MATLLVLSTAAFVVGRQIERSEERHTEGAHTEQGAEPSPPEGAEAEEKKREERGEDGGKALPSEGAQAEEKEGEDAGGELFGVNTDDPELTVVAVMLSLLLAADVALRGSRTLLRFVVLFGLVFTGLDLFWEVRRQIGESNGVTTAAALVAVLHVGVVGAAVVALRRGVRDQVGITPA